MTDTRTITKYHYPHTSNADPRPAPVTVAREPWEPCSHDGCPYDAGDTCGLMACPGRAK